MSELKYKKHDRFIRREEFGSEHIIEIKHTREKNTDSYYVEPIKNYPDGQFVNCWVYDEWFSSYYVKIEPEENTFQEITSSILKMVTEKDKRYGNSALQPLEIFAKHHNYGSRLDEKLARVKNSDELRKNDVADIIGGLILICKDKGWNNFDDQID